jgi:hypothetical protein
VRQRAKQPEDFRIEDYLKGSLGIFRAQGAYEVVIDLDRWGADLVRGRRWHQSQVLTELPGGELRVAFHLSSLEEIEPCVLSWGDARDGGAPQGTGRKDQGNRQGALRPVWKRADNRPRVQATWVGAVRVRGALQPWLAAALGCCLGGSCPKL